MENKKTNAPANADQSILQEQTSANLNSGQQDDYNKPAAINQGKDNDITQLNHLSDNILELSIFAERANFMLCSLLNNADESKEQSWISFNFPNIVTMANIALDYMCQVNKSISEIETQVNTYIDSIRSKNNE